MLPFIVASENPTVRMLTIARFLFSGFAQADARCGGRGVCDLLRIALVAMESAHDDLRRAEIERAGHA